MEYHGGTGGGIPAAVEKHIRANFFAPEDFGAFILNAAKRGDTMQQVFALLRGAPLPGEEAIPYHGESKVYEEVLKVAAADKIAINVGGTWHCREATENDEAALHQLRQRAWPRGNDFRMVRLGLPSQVGSGGVAVTPPVVTPPIGPPGTQPPTVPGAEPGTPGTSPPGTQPPVVVPPGGTVPPVAPAAPVIRDSLGAKTGINLLGDLEDWGYPDNQRITQASLTFNDLSVKEIRDVCTKLPPKIRAKLQITLPPEGEQPQ